ncbi:MAG: hypothetical protein K2X47_10530, partial [Bdellovibrionales bacterium]|nr:hypothetical protein [Bdellovibrionales bacterium]
PAPGESQDFGLNAKLQDLLLLGGLRNYLAFEGRLKNPKLADLPFKKVENPRKESGCEFQMFRDGYPPASLFISQKDEDGYHPANVIYGEGKQNQRTLNCRISEELLSRHSCFKNLPQAGARPRPGQRSQDHQGM